MKQSILTNLAVLVCTAVLVALTGSAAAQEGLTPAWRYHASTDLGLSHCESAFFGDGKAMVNTAQIAKSTNGVTISGETGKTVRIRFVCERAQEKGARSELLRIGPEGTYNANPGGAGMSVGFDKPTDDPNKTALHKALAKGREWVFTVGAQPQTIVLTWSGELGSDKLSVTVQPFAPPPTVPQVQEMIAPVEQKADEAQTTANDAYSRAAHDNLEKYRFIAVTLGYQLGLNTLARDGGNADMGANLNIDYSFGPAGAFKGLTGMVAMLNFVQKPVMEAPNATGYNNWIDSQTLYVGPKIGFDYMPAKWFDLRVFASLGAFISFDGSVPLTQLPDGRLFTSEAQTNTALGWMLMAQPGFVIGNFLIQPQIGIGGTMTKVQTELGPDFVCSAHEPNCAERRDGFVFRVHGGLNAGVIF